MSKKRDLNKAKRAKQNKKAKFKRRISKQLPLVKIDSNGNEIVID